MITETICDKCGREDWMRRTKDNICLNCIINDLEERLSKLEVEKLVK